MTHLFSRKISVEQKLANAAYQRDWYLRNRDKRRAQASEYYRQNQTQCAIQRAGYYQRTVVEIKTDVLTHYGDAQLKCVLCPEERLGALTIDHVDGGGTKHFAALKKIGKAFYRWLQKSEYPTGYRTLCMNCNILAHLTKIVTENYYSRHARAIKRQFMNTIGGCCVGCGMDNLDILTVHHVNNDGAEHRRLLGVTSGCKFYRAMMKSGDFETFKMECRCFNCNCEEEWSH